MPEDNAELLRRAVDAYNRQDVEALLRELDPAVEWHPAVPGAIGSDLVVYRGRAGIERMFSDFAEVLTEIEFEISEIRDLGDRVVAIGTLRTRGKASGAVTEAPYVNVADLRDGKGIRIRGLLGGEEALEQLDQ